MRFLSKKSDPKPVAITKVQKIRKEIQGIILSTNTRLTLLDIERQLSRDCRYSRKVVRLGIKSLVDEQELMYVSDSGHTFIEVSFHKPIRISPSIILKPFNSSVKQADGDIIVSLCHGSSFGSGQHPTTRLCLKGLEYLFGNGATSNFGKRANVLDIGTGTGVLIITALKMGFASGMGIDIDPCSVSEARNNVACNGLSNRISISAQPFDKIVDSYNLMLANLRLPTLKSFFPQMVNQTKPGGVILISGIKKEECAPIVKQSRGLDVDQKWMDEERGWAAIGFQKKNKKGAHSDERTPFF